MTGRIIALFAVGVSLFAAIGSAPAQQPACQYYQVAAPSLNVFAQPRADSSFVESLKKNDFVCVAGEKDVQGDRTWVHITAVVAPKTPNRAMDGWAIQSALQPAAPADIAALSAPPQAPTSKPQSPPGGSAPVPPAASNVQPSTAEQKAVTFTGTLTEGPTPVNGSSLEQLITGVPEFSPIDGLPDEAWKKTCNNCHQWNKQSLCVQAKIYADDPKMALRKQHPYGGPEKVAMMKWAQGGCQ
jgi:hypothetical protein